MIDIIAELAALVEFGFITPSQAARKAAEIEDKQ
tara:strand:+ start:40 stop:141 length:102 start_codon:yes stop_codon:yes gene_type:complete